MRPRNAGELAEMLAGSEGPLVVRGGGTKSWSAPPTEPPTVVETGELNAIVEHNVGDYTAVLGAGITLSAAQKQFAMSGQQLALDPSTGRDAAATLGGVLATNDSGPLRHRFGGMRDLVVGAQIALSDGSISHSGGKVIKNVAGYDIAKLLCGSNGTLGVICQMTVRLHPLAETTATAVGSSDDPEILGAAAIKLAAQPLEADSLDLDWDAGAGSLLVRFSGPIAADRAAAVGLAELGLEASVIEDDTDLWERQRARQRGDCILKVAGRITDLPAVCRAAPAVVGRAGLGLYWLSLEPTEEAIADARAALAPHSATLLDAPDALRGLTWPKIDPGALALMKRVKSRFDPAHRLAPGTYAGGI